MSKEPIESLERALVSWKILLGAMIGLLAFGFGTSSYLTRYALAADVARVKDQVAAHGDRLDVITQRLQEMKETQDRQLEQLWEIARYMGAPVVQGKQKGKP